MSADAILFVTPEYNRSIPGALKNALDVGSRPWGERTASQSFATWLERFPQRKLT